MSDEKGPPPMLDIDPVGLERKRKFFTAKSRDAKSKKQKIPDEELRRREPKRPKSNRSSHRTGQNSSKSDYRLQVNNEYPQNWDALRRQAYKRDDYQCQNCGVKGGRQGTAELHAHHIVPLSSGGNNVLNNLSTLCSTCHSLIHTHLD